jgi:hypothetical protein
MSTVYNLQHEKQHVEAVVVGEVSLTNYVRGDPRIEEKQISFL